MNRLKEESLNPVGVLEQVKYRADWIKHQEIQRRKEEQALEKERGLLILQNILLRTKVLVTIIKMGSKE